MDFRSRLEPLLTLDRCRFNQHFQAIRERVAPRFSPQLVCYSRVTGTSDVALGTKGKKFFMLHVLRERLDYPDLKRAVQAQAEHFRPTNILIEDKASGTQLIQELIREGVSRVTRYDPTMDKVMRLHSVSSTIENGFVYLPTEADWLAAYLHELTTFPNGKHDDQADSTSQALDWAKQFPSRLPLEEYHHHLLMRWKTSLPDEYIFKQCDEDEEIIAEHCWTGERIRWNGQFWQECG